jgi:hypothetical protein
MKWLRECFAEYARHPLPAFIGLAIIAASLVTAAMAFIRRHAGSEPSAPLAGTGQNAQPAAPAPRAPRPSPPPAAPSSVLLVSAAQSETAPIAPAAEHPRARHRTHLRPRQHRLTPHPHGRNDHRPRHQAGLGSRNPQWASVGC